MDAFLGEIRGFPYSFMPQGWAECNGALLPISQQTALFSLLGTTYGGDGRVNFAVPDLRGRAMVQCGTGPLGELVLGENGGGGGAVATGSATLSLGPASTPAHVHTATFTPGAATAPVQPQIAFNASTDQASGSVAPAGGFLSAQPASSGSASNIYSATASGSTTLAGATATASGGSGGGITGGTVALANAGSGTAVAPMTAEVPGALPPFVAIRYGICINGLFPQRP